MRSPVTSSLVLRSLTGEVCSRELSKWAGMSESPLQQRLPTLDADSSFNPIPSQSTLPVSTLCQPVIAWKGSQKALHRLSAHHRRICRLASGWCAWSASTKTLGLLKETSFDCLISLPALKSHTACAINCVIIPLQVQGKNNTSHSTSTFKLRKQKVALGIKLFKLHLQTRIRTLESKSLDGHSLHSLQKPLSWRIIPIAYR